MIDEEKRKSIGKNIERNKLYFIDNKKNVRNLKKSSKIIYDLVVNKFVKEDGIYLYSLRNRGKKFEFELQPIGFKIDCKYKEEFLKLKAIKESDVLFYSQAKNQNKNNIVVFYSDIKNPLVKIEIAN